MARVSFEDELDQRFLTAVASLPADAVAADAVAADAVAADADAAGAAGPLGGGRLLELFDAQAGSRHLDLAAR